MDAHEGLRDDVYGEYLFLNLFSNIDAYESSRGNIRMSLPIIEGTLK